MKELISVIIPAYNCEDTIRRCLDSVLSQTHKDLEIIVVNDGSSDNTLSIIEEYSHKDSRVIVINQENKGVSIARNKALEIIKGDNVCFVDSDDYLELNAYENMLNIKLNNNADILICDFYRKNHSDFKSGLYNHNESLELLLSNKMMYGALWNKMYSKEIINNIKMPDIKLSEDLVFNYLALKKSNRIYISDQRLYHYTENSDSLSNRTFSLNNYDAVKARKIIYEDIENSFKEKALFSYVFSQLIYYDGLLKNGLFDENMEQVYKELINSLNELKKERWNNKKIYIKLLILKYNKKLYKKLFIK